MAPILKFFVNSLIVSFASTALNVFILAMAGYVFAKKKFRFKNLIFGILSLSMVIPSTALMSPVYTVITKLHLYDTKMALILVYTALNMPISLMILRSAFAAIPTELEEAAYIDGAGFFRTFWQVMMPCAKGGSGQRGSTGFSWELERVYICPAAHQFYQYANAAAVAELLHLSVQLQLHRYVRGDYHCGPTQHHRILHIPGAGMLQPDRRLCKGLRSLNSKVRRSVCYPQNRSRKTADPSTV